MMGIINTLLKDQNVISFAVSIGANVTWEMMKNFALTHRKETSSEYLVYCVFEDAFRDFYAQKKFEFDSAIVMDAFIEQVKCLDNTTLTHVDYKIIERVVGNVALNNEDMELFVVCLCRTLSQPKYNAIRHELELRERVSLTSDADYSWMNDYMNDNWCKIEIPKADSLYEMFGKINTTLENAQWERLQDCMFELALNAQTHGKAKTQKIKIEKTKIVLFDDGKRYNPEELLAGKRKGGGTLSLKLLMEEIPDINTKHVYRDSTNRFTIEFEKEVFDVNRICELVVPNLVSFSEAFLMYRGKYKYCYVDMQQTIENSMNRVTLSGIYSLFRFADNLIADNISEKVFLFFPDYRKVEIDRAYKKCINVLQDCGKTNIILIPENNIIK